MRLNTQSVMDGRKCVVYLLNDRKLELSVHTKQLGKDLWETVVSKLHLREEDYFGLKYKTSGEHYSWLQLDRKVLDHDLDMKSTDYPLEFIFSVKFFEDSVTVHKHPSTVELIYLHAQALIYNGEVCVPTDLSLELSAYSLQAFYGDFVSEEEAFANFKKLSCLPRSVIQELPSLQYCEEQVISWYKNLCGFSRGQAVLLYMNKAEKLPNYGIHFFKVKDKARVPWWLGICNKGIYQYRLDNKVAPQNVFQWRNLENLYFREKKFSVEVCSGHKRALSTGSTHAVAEKAKKTGNNHQTPKTHAWYGSPALIKSIWTMAIAQHQFYWDRKQSSKSKSHVNKTNASNLRNALDKNSNTHIVPPSDDNIMQRKNNHKKAQPTTKVKKVAPKPPVRSDVPQSPEVKALEEKMITDLKKRRLALEDRLYDKVQQLKEICKEEYNLTEKLPIDYLRYMLPSEGKPVLKKKIGAEFRVQLRPHPNRSYKHDTTSAELQKLETECDLLNQIANAAYKLANDPSSKGRTKRKRLQSYQKSLKKLQDVEDRIDGLREKQGQEAAFRQSTLIMTSDFDIMNAIKECSIEEKSDRGSLSSGNMLDDETSVSSGAEVHSTHSTPALSQRPYSRSADVDMDELPRSRTPPPIKSPKLAWLQSPRVKSKKDQISLEGSYPVLPSPSSYRSTTSHSSGADTPPHIGTRWDQSRHRDGWKMSSLDSLDSIGSRKSNDPTHGSPTKHHVGNGDIPNANARRIARAAKSAQAHKVSLREKHGHSEPSRRMGTINPVLEIVQDTVPGDGKDSRTSLTDSGHGTDSRVQSCYEEEVPGKKKTTNAIRREISDSSLSELSTQSNPAVLPSSRNIPKFVPYFMTTRNRATTHLGQTSTESTKEIEQPHVRKRSSSFTESASSTLQKPTSRRDPHRTLTRSKTHTENETPTPDVADVPRPNGDIPSHQNSSDVNHPPGLPTSHSESQLQPPIFDTNLNICRQYLSRSQGQLEQNNAAGTPTPESTDKTSGMPYISVVDKGTKQVVASNPASVQRPMTYNVSANNSNNNKLNFGQIYKLSQANATQQNYTRLHYNPNEKSQPPVATVAPRNVPKCGSLDSVLDRGHSQRPDVNPDTLRNYGLEQQQPIHPGPTQYPPFYSPPKNAAQRSGTPQVPTPEESMSSFDRDKLNNEAFQEIRGMAWVPSLDEYGSRASVAESLPAKSKRADIRELLQQHIAQNWIPKRTPSSSSTTVMRSKRERQLQARIRAEMMREKESQSTSQSTLKSGSAVNTWEDYKQSMTWKKNQNQSAFKPMTKTEHTAVNIFAHKQPPPLPQQAQRNYANSADTASSYSQGTIHKGYVNPNGYVVPMPVNDRRPTYPFSYDNNSDYGTTRSQKSSHSVYSVATAQIPFERGVYISATLPRKYGFRECSPQQNNHEPPLRSSPQGKFPRTYSSPPGQPPYDPSFRPAPNRSRHRHQHSADSLLAHSFTSPPHSFPAADERQNQPSNHVASKSNQHPGKMMQPMQQSQANYHYQTQQSKSPEDAEDKCQSSTKDVSETEDGPLVIQATRTSPDGHKVSVFTVSKSAPSTPLPPKQSEGKDEGDIQFFDADKTITNDSEKTPVVSPNLFPRSLSYNSERSNTDALQAMAIEAARAAQEAIKSSRGSFEKFRSPTKIPPPLPATPPNSNLRASTKGRRSTIDSWTPVKGSDQTRKGRQEKSNTTPRRSLIPETKTPRSRSKTRKDRESSAGRSSSPPTPSAVSNGVTIPVRDLRGGAKTPTRRRSPSPRPVTPNFQRTLSTPIRTKPVPLQPNGSPKSNKSTGMYKEHMSGPSARSRPPAPPRVTASTPTPTRSVLKTASAESRLLGTPRPVFQIGQSGTLPRTPKTHKRLERSGSTSGAEYKASRIARPISTTPASEPRNQHGRSYIQPPRKDLYNALLGSDALKYKRSLSETWKQQNLTAVKIPQQHQNSMPDASYHHQIYQNTGQQGMDPRSSHNHPRRTASADDLLWPTPDGRDPNANLNMRTQGTLV